MCKKKYSGASGIWYHRQNDKKCYPVPPIVHRKQRLAKKPTYPRVLRVNGLKVRYCLDKQEDLDCCMYKQEDLDYCMAVDGWREALDVQIGGVHVMVGCNLPPEVNQVGKLWDIPDVAFRDTVNTVNTVFNTTGSSIELVTVDS